MNCLRAASVLALVAGLAPTLGAQTWSDEFNGTGAVDGSKWTFDLGGGGFGNNELQTYTSSTSNANQENGYLRIAARQAGSGYTSARLKTQGRMTFGPYGKVEARLRGPMGQGLWPAFWMLGNNIPQVGWPACGEIDIMEHINTGGNVFGTIHWDLNGYQFYTAAQPGVNFAAWNTYAIEWTPSYIRWLLNGANVGEANILNNINGTDEFHRPFFLILNLAVGGNWPGSPNASTPFPAFLDVDYVRYWASGAPPAGNVVFFRDVNYAGPASQGLPPGNYTLSQLQARGVPNDWASSARIPAGRTVTMYQHDNFTGTSWVRTSDTPNFVALTPNANDQMSSVRIQ
jgi:beta-glucanase (GH16 family)